jgi:hypothetical protein
VSESTERPEEPVNDNGRPTWYEQRHGDAYPHVDPPPKGDPAPEERST